MMSVVITTTISYREEQAYLTTTDNFMGDFQFHGCESLVYSIWANVFLSPCF